MRGKHLNSGIRDGLWEDEHLQRMGPAVWLFGWLVHRQTRERHGVGLVLGGSPLTYEIISEDTGMAVRTLKRWMARLSHAGYVRVRHTAHKRMVIEISKAKKFGPQQLKFPQRQASFPQTPFFALKSKGPLPACEGVSKGPSMAPNKVAETSEVIETTGTCDNSSEQHREFTSERKETRTSRPPSAQVKPQCIPPLASSGTPPVRSYAIHNQPDWKTLREMQLRAELRVGSGPEIHRE